MDWMISIQLGRRNITDSQKAYLRGLQYEREKIKEQWRGNQHTNEAAEKTSAGNTAERLAEQHKVNERTIREDGKYAKAVDKIAEKYRPIYEKKAEENKSVFKGNQYTNGHSASLPTSQKVDTRAELAKIAGVGERTYGKGAKILVCN